MGEGERGSQTQGEAEGRAVQHTRQGATRTRQTARDQSQQSMEPPIRPENQDGPESTALGRNASEEQSVVEAMALVTSSHQGDSDHAEADGEGQTSVSQESSRGSDARASSTSDHQSDIQSVPSSTAIIVHADTHEAETTTTTTAPTESEHAIQESPSLPPPSPVRQKPDPNLRSAYIDENGERREVPGMVEPGVFLSSGVSSYTDDDWRFILTFSGAVFARATPQDKLVIVQACQRLGEVVAVTGDGVNDAPALKQANIGIAMGLKGNAVAREAADALLMDDNFASIVAGILEGRLIIDNLRKSIRYILAHLLPEVLPALMNLSLGLPLGMTPLQILSIDLGTEMAAAFTLAYEPPEPGIMERPPRKLGERLITRELLIYSYLIAGTIEALACFLAYWQVYLYYGLTLGDIFLQGDNHFQRNPDFVCLDNGQCYTASQQEDIAGTATSAWYITLIMSQVVHLFVIKAFNVSIFRMNPFNNFVTWIGVLIEITIMLVVVYAPGIQEFMGARDPLVSSWFFWLGSGVLLITVAELRLCILSRRHRRMPSGSAAVVPFDRRKSLEGSLAAKQSPQPGAKDDPTIVCSRRRYGPWKSQTKSNALPIGETVVTDVPYPSVASIV
eukprot:m.169125 g.169125  ORF g.169125 m.169125 type:complete len:620 (+) comp16472_c2_seq1:404-2263(+)